MRVSVRLERKFDFLTRCLSLSPFLSQLLYGCYTHCVSIPTLHRRSYWLIQVCTCTCIHMYYNMYMQFAHVKDTSGIVYMYMQYNNITIYDVHVCAYMTEYFCVVLHTCAVLGMQ